jgi:hypothetical protein
MYLFRCFNLLPFSLPTNATKALIFLQKWSILIQLKNGKKSTVRGRKKREKLGDGSENKRKNQGVSIELNLVDKKIDDHGWK